MNSIARTTMNRALSRSLFSQAKLAKPPSLLGSARLGRLCLSMSAPPMATTFISRMDKHRFFSSSSDTLLDILSREHAEEQANQTTGMPEALKELTDKLSATWKIVDAGAVTKLHKTVGAFKVQISFHCQDETEPEVPVGNEEEDEEPGISVRFTVTATKAGKSLVLICVSEDSVAYIKNALMADSDVDAIHNTGVDTTGYQGPEFSELAEDLQDAFVGFLEEELGVTDDVAAFIAMQADYQEQCQYVKFLENAKNVVS
jgi:complement component 1 Q subcomponent-binding protein, mitochondrial